MKQSLSDILTTICDHKSTGMLTVGFSLEKNLLKIYFKDGLIYHISFGLKKGIQCLDEIENKEPLSFNFIQGLSIEISSIEISSHDKIIELFKNLNKFVSRGEILKKESLNFERIKENLKIALTRQIGPIGRKLVDKYVLEKWIASNPPSRDDFLRLIEMLKNEIDDPLSQSEFSVEATKVLEGYL